MGLEFGSQHSSPRHVLEKERELTKQNNKREPWVFETNHYFINNTLFWLQHEPQHYSILIFHLEMICYKNIYYMQTYITIFSFNSTEP